MRDSASQRILILSSNTGGGHQSAASALEESFIRLGSSHQVLVNIAQVLEDAHIVTRHFAGMYNYLLRYHQHYMKYYYRAIERLKPYESNFIFQLSLKYGLQLVEKITPTTLVSVHPMTQHFFAYILKKLRLTDKIPLITVVTDPCAGFWKGWACQEVAQYHVASQSAKEQLIEYGIFEDRIKVSGMPVHSKFRPLGSDDEKLALRQQLGLDPNRFTVLVNSGWVGGGNIPQLYKALSQIQADAPIQLVFISGRNESLRQEACQVAQAAPYPVHVLGFTQEIDQYMNAADIMISKLGGLTTFEAMACQLPILADCLTPPMPQEAGTANLISTNGAGVLITEPSQVLAELERLTHSPQSYMQMKQAAAAIGRPGAVDLIAKDILHYQNN
jgi:UDP-N-acetylglucosamine:LPS N-acetylglucosamine transferase